MKYILSIFFLLTCFASFGQQPTEDTARYMKYPNAYGPQYTTGWFTQLFRLPDTSAMRPQTGAPGAFGRNAAGTKIFMWDGDEWIEVTGGGSGGTQTWQQTLDQSSVLDKNNYIDGGGFVFNIDSANNILLYATPTAPNNFSSTEMLSRDSLFQRFAGFGSTYGSGEPLDTQIIATMYARNILTQKDNILHLTDTSAYLYQGWGGAGSDNTYQKFAHPPPIVNQQYYIPLTVTHDGSEPVVADSSGNIDLGDITSGSDTAHLTADIGIIIDNDEGVYKPNGSDRLIYLDTAYVGDLVTQIIQNDTTIFQIDSNDITYFVDSIVFAPPPSPVDGDIYLIGDPATGDFTGKEDQIAERVGGAWSYTIPNSGDIVAVTNPLTAFYKYNGAVWVFLRRVPSIGGDALGVAEDLGNLSSKAVSLITNAQRRLIITSGGKVRVTDFRGATTDTSRNYVKVVDSLTGELGLGRFRQLIAGDNITITAGENETDTISSTGGGGDSGSSTDSLSDVTRRNGNSHYYTSIGDSIITTNPTDSIIFYGTSVTTGGNASAAKYQFTTIAAMFGNAVEFNRGYGASTMVEVTANDSSMVNRIYTIPTWRTTLKGIVFEYMINDAVSNLDTADFRASYYEVIDSCIARGWPLNRICIMTAGWFPGNGGYPNNRNIFINLVRSIAAAKGVGLGDAARIFETEGLNTSRTVADSLHPNDVGHYYMAAAALNGLGFKHSALFNVQGNTTSNYLTLVRASMRKPAITFKDSAFADEAYLLYNSHSLLLGDYSLNNTGTNNNIFGIGSFTANTTGSNNVGMGLQTLQNNTTGGSNITAGVQAMRTNTTGSNNIAIGTNALYNNTTASNNTAIGHGALYTNTTGIYNTAVGQGALQNNTTGEYNSGFGINAALATSTGNQNVALGANALPANTTGSRNIGIGFYAIKDATTSWSNIGIGISALQSTTSGQGNVSVGDAAARDNTTGGFNVVLGYEAYNLSAASTAVTAANNSVAIGYNVRSGTTTPTNEIVIGYNAYGRGSNTGKLGNSSITDLYTDGTFHAPTPGGSTTTDSVVVWRASDSSFRRVPALVDGAYNVTYAGTETWNSTAPTSNISHYYSWTKTGRQVTFEFYTTYTNAGTTNTTLELSWPAGLPNPLEPTGYSVPYIIAKGGGGITAGINTVNNSGYSFIRKDALNNYIIGINANSVSATSAYCTITYISAN